MVDISGILGKLEGNAQTIGMLGGTLAALNYYGNGNPFGGIKKIVDGLMSNPHFPNIEGFMGSLAPGTQEGTNFQTGIIAAVAGYLIKELNLHPALNRLGNFAANGGIGYIEATLLLNLIAHCSIWGSEAS